MTLDRQLAYLQNTAIIMRFVREQSVQYSVRYLGSKIECGRRTKKRPEKTKVLATPSIKSYRHMFMNALATVIWRAAASCHHLLVVTVWLDYNY